MRLPGPVGAWLAGLIGAGSAAVLIAAADGGTTAAGKSATARAVRACNDSVATPVPQPTGAHMAAAGLDRLPVAPSDRRVDLVAPAFSDSTNVTNPLFPISRLASVVLNGRVDGKAFRTETTLLPDTRIIEWSPGQCVKTLVSPCGGRRREANRRRPDGHRSPKGARTRPGDALTRPTRPRARS